MPTEIDALIASINRKAKWDVLVRGADLVHVTYQRNTTGSLAFDLMLGGGWPLNCWNEVIGNESSGKTTMILKTIAANQAANPELSHPVGGLRGLRPGLGSRTSVSTSPASPSSRPTSWSLPTTQCSP